MSGEVVVHGIRQVVKRLEAEQAAKLDAYVGLLKTLRMEAVAAKAEKEQWAAKEKARTARAGNRGAPCGCGRATPWADRHRGYSF